MADSQNISDLLVRIEATTAGLRRELDKGDSQVKKFSKSGQSSLDGFEKKFDALASGAMRLVPAIGAAVGAVEGLQKIVEVQREFDKLNAGLITATGSSEKAAVAFGALQNFAQKTPYSLSQAVEGFTKLVNLGLTPSEKALMSYGNTASALGKDLSQMVEAVADATTSEFERLLEFGIKAKQNGDKVSLTFRGMTKTIGNNAKEIEEYLISLGEVNFGDAMTNRMKTLDGAISNLSDNWDTLFLSISQSGVGDAIAEAVGVANDALSELIAEFQSGEIEAYLKAVQISFDGWGEDIANLLVSLDELFQKFWGSLGPEADGAVKAITDAFAHMPENIRSLVQILTVELFSGFDKIKTYASGFVDVLKAIFTGDDFMAANNAVMQQISAIDQARQDSIAGILDENAAAVKAVNDQVDAAKNLRAVYDENRKKRAADTTDVLAQFKAQGDGSKQASQASVKAAEAAKKAAEGQAKALTDLTSKTSLQAKTANEIADAYFKGADQLQKYSLQQQIEEALLKTGAAARDKVTAALTAEANARDRQDLAKSYYDLKQETDQLLAQATATLQGKDAIDAYNDSKALAALLAGKNADALGDEVKQLQGVIKANREASKALEDAGKVEGILDRLDPQAKAAKDYASEVEVLNRAMERYPDKAAQYQDALRKLGIEYEANQRQANVWGKFTEGAIDRIDSAFADGWKNIDKGFKGFASGLLDSFKQLLAEMAHLAITKPIIMQIGAALGLGGLSGTANASSLLGSLGGGGFSLNSLASMGASAYSFITGTGASIYNAFQSGGLAGVYNYGSSALSGLFSTGTGSTAAGYANVSQFMATPTGTVNGLFGSGLSAGATGLAGLGGALYGYGQSGLKGAATGGLGAAGGAILGNMLLPGIGGIIGSALGGFIGGSLFGGKWQTKDMGLSLGVSGGDLDAQQYEYQKKKGGLFGKNKKRTRYSALDDATQAAFDSIYDSTTTSVTDLYKTLGIGFGEQAIDGLTIAATQFSTKDKTEEEINQAVTAWFSGVADEMVKTVNTFGNLGLNDALVNGGVSFASLQALVGNLYSVNSMLDTLKLTTMQMSIPGALAAQALMNLAGGMEALTTNVNTYYQNFFSAAEQQQDLINNVRKQFQALNITLPETRDGYRKMVEALDLTTAAGQDMFTKLTGMAGMAAQAYSALEEQANAAKEAAEQAAAAARQVLVDGVGKAFAALQRAVTAQQQKLTDAYNARVASLNDMVSTANSNISTLTQLSGSLHSALQQLRGGSNASGIAYQNATAQLRKALSGGSLTGVDLTDALSAVTGNTSDRYSSWADFARDQGRSANLLEALEGKTNGQLTAQEKTLAALQKQLDLAKAQYDDESTKLQGQIDLAQAQIDAINGVDNTILSVVDAVNRMHASLIALSPNGTGAMNANQIVNSIYQAVLGRAPDAEGAAYWKGQLTSGAISSNDLAAMVRMGAQANGEIINSAYQKVLGRAPDASGYATWKALLDSGAVTPEGLAEAIRSVAMANGEIPGFAKGGSFAGGARIVGENGPELEVTGPSRIYSHQETQNMFSSNNEDLIAEVRALRQEIANQTSLQSQITRNTAKTARYTQQMNEVGLPAMES